MKQRDHPVWKTWLFGKKTKKKVFNQPKHRILKGNATKKVFTTKLHSPLKLKIQVR